MSTFSHLAKTPVKIHSKYYASLIHVNKHLQIAGCISFLELCGEQPQPSFLKATGVCYFLVFEYREPRHSWSSAWGPIGLELRCWLAVFPSGGLTRETTHKPIRVLEILIFLWLWNRDSFFLPHYGFRIVHNSLKSPLGPSLMVSSTGPLKTWLFASSKPLGAISPLSRRAQIFLKDFHPIKTDPPSLRLTPHQLIWHLNFIFKASLPCPYNIAKSQRNSDHRPTFTSTSKEKASFRVWMPPGHLGSCPGVLSSSVLHTPSCKHVATLLVSRTLEKRTDNRGVGSAAVTIPRASPCHRVGFDAQR